MPSFDIVSEVDMHEVANAVDQTNREVGTRFDFKGTDSRVERSEAVLTVHSDSEFQVRQILDILHAKLARRGVDIAQDTARKLIRLIKESKLKVQGSIQGEKVRVTGKKRDDLQTAINTLRNAGLDLPLQFINFRD